MIKTLDPFQYCNFKFTILFKITEHMHCKSKTKWKYFNVIVYKAITVAVFANDRNNKQ